MNAYRSLAFVLAAVIFAMVFGLVPIIQWLFTKVAEAIALILYRLTHLAAIEVHGPYADLTDLGSLLILGILLAAAIKFLFGRRS